MLQDRRGAQRRVGYSLGELGVVGQRHIPIQPPGRFGHLAHGGRPARAMARPVSPGATSAMGPVA